MIPCKEFYDYLVANNLDFFCGVPDSLLKDFCSYVYDHTPTGSSVITANEGNAIAMAAGYHLATSKTGVVYMQNSGLGNCVNPLLSLVDPEVYRIPVLLIIGWRGEPGVKDEPQHVKQGKVTLDLLDAMKIPHKIMPAELDRAKESVSEAIGYMKKEGAPYALVVRKSTFEKYVSEGNGQGQKPFRAEMSREDALCEVLKHVEPGAVIVSTTGKLSRELFEYRKRNNQGHEKDFLTVGSMGHTLSIAAGIALAMKDGPKGSKAKCSNLVPIYCFDGDGSVLMHAGSLGINASLHLPNLRHIVFNNASHDSVGGQPTIAGGTSLADVARSFGYPITMRVWTREELAKVMAEMAAPKSQGKGSYFLEIMVQRGARPELGRPDKGPEENKKRFMGFVSSLGVKK